MVRDERWEEKCWANRDTSCVVELNRSSKVTTRYTKFRSARCFCLRCIFKLRFIILEHPSIKISNSRSPSWNLALSHVLLIHHYAGEEIVHNYGMIIIITAYTSLIHYTCILASLRWEIESASPWQEIFNHRNCTILARARRVYITRIIISVMRKVNLRHVLRVRREVRMYFRVTSFT